MRHPVSLMLTWTLVWLLPTVGFGAASSDLSLAEAVKRGDHAAVSQLVAGKADVNQQLPDGASALAWAVYRDEAQTVDLLIRAGADVNAVNEYGVSPLSLACTNANVGIVISLLRAGANPALAKWTGETPLLTCARTGNAAAVAALLDKGADINAKENQRGQTALMWAVAAKHPEVVKLLIARGANVNATSRLLETHTPKMIEYYLPDVHYAKSKGGFTPLMFASRVGDLASASLLLSSGADINAAAPEYGTSLTVAIASGQEDVALLLIDKGADVSATDGVGLTALHWALQGGIKALFGAPASATDRFWNHPSMPKVVKALLTRGADPNARIKSNFMPYDTPLFSHDIGNNLPHIGLQGATPFLLAAATADVSLMRVLVEGRANPKLVAVDGTTPLMVAAGLARERVSKNVGMTPEDEQASLEAVKMALKLGVNVNEANANGRTALHGAVEMGANTIVQFLVENGADLEAKDKYGQTPLTIALGDPGQLIYRQLEGGRPDDSFRAAILGGQKETADLLLKLGAKPYTGIVVDRSGQ
jgi:uncharacterized protein